MKKLYKNKIASQGKFAPSQIKGSLGRFSVPVPKIKGFNK